MFQIKKVKKKPKYNNKKVIIDNITFHSTKEGKRYLDLKILLRVGKIFDLKLQPKFLLHDSFRYQGKTERKIHYIADFSYIENKKVIIEDVKGKKTEVYKIKRKMFLMKYVIDNDLMEFRET